MEATIMGLYRVYIYIYPIVVILRSAGCFLQGHQQLRWRDPVPSQ